MNALHLAPELLVVLGGVAALLTSTLAGRPRRWLVPGVALAALAAAAAASVTLAVTVRPQLSMEGAWATDGVTRAAELIVLGATGLVVVLSPAWLDTDPRAGEYQAVLLFSAAGALALAGAADTMEIVVGLLLVSVTGYTLAAYHRASAASVEAGMKYFLIGALTNTILLIGVVVLFGLAGTTRLATIADVLRRDAAAPVALVAVVVTVAVGLAFEIGAVPAHAWVPDVAQGAPAPSAAFLTVVPKVGAVVALARFVAVLPDGAGGWRAVTAALAAATMTLGNLAALWQRDLRRLLGWSTVSQAGYALMAVVVIRRSDLAVVSLLFFLASYAAANVAAFGVVVQLRGRTDLAGYRGLGRSRPLLAAVLAVALLSLVGIPPLGGFVGKLTLFIATIDGGYWWLAVLAVANTVVSLFYYLRVLAPIYLSEPVVETVDAVDAAPRGVGVLGAGAATAAIAAGVAVVALGVAAQPVLAALRHALLLPGL